MVGVHRVPAHRQRFAASYVLPDELTLRLSHRYPDAGDVGPALRGLRQWLRLRILTDEPMGMPSSAVNSALEEFLTLGNSAAAFRGGAYGHHSADRLIQGVLPDEAAGETMALTWAMACNDQQLDPKAPETIPILFAADALLQVTGGWLWTVYCGHQKCTATDCCVHHDLLASLPKQLPHQDHFGTPRPYSLKDKSDSLWGPVV